MESPSWNSLIFEFEFYGGLLRGGGSFRNHKSGAQNFDLMQIGGGGGVYHPLLDLHIRDRI